MEEDAFTEAVALRSDLMRAIRREMRRWRSSRTAAAARLGVNRAQLSDLAHNRIDQFSLDALVALASRAGLVVRLEIQASGAPDLAPEDVAETERGPSEAETERALAVDAEEDPAEFAYLDALLEDEGE